MVTLVDFVAHVVHTFTNMSLEFISCELIHCESFTMQSFCLCTMCWETDAELRRVKNSARRRPGNG